VLGELGGAWIVTMSEKGNLATAYASLGQAFDLALNGRLATALPPRHEASFEACFLAESLTHEQGKLFDHAVVSALKDNR
jgi:hypothetical protein